MHNAVRKRLATIYVPGRENYVSGRENEDSFVVIGYTRGNEAVDYIQDL